MSTPLTRKVKINIVIEILTNKSDEQVESAIKRGVYMGLDREPTYIAQPANINITKLEVKQHGKPPKAKDNNNRVD
jgi:hypothetical protein